ncbi:MAG: XdhC family protein [Pseudomonadota bacterium]
MKRDLFEQVLEAKAERRPVAVITHLASGAQRLVARAAAGEDALADLLDTAFRFDKSQVVTQDGEEYFVDIHNPPLKMIMIGAVHIAQALIPMAKATGYDVTIVDPRGAFATEERFPDVGLIAEWPDEVLNDVGLDARTAMVALTHDPKIDDPALQMALNSDVFYIGALGSKRTHASRLDRLKEHQFGDETLARIKGPIGLNIGAKGQAEIAVAIMAQVIEHLRLGGEAS